MCVNILISIKQVGANGHIVIYSKKSSYHSAQYEHKNFRQTKGEYLTVINTLFIDFIELLN